MADLLRGVVKWFNDAKGFGFIEHESGRDVFVHYSVIVQEGFKTLKDGEEVDYELTEGDKGLHAAKVVRLNIPLSPEDQATLGIVTSTQSTAIEKPAETLESRIEIMRDYDGVEKPLSRPEATFQDSDADFPKQ